jgi:hypothetical protein
VEKMEFCYFEIEIPTNVPLCLPLTQGHKVNQTIINWKRHFDRVIDWTIFIKSKTKKPEFISKENPKKNYKETTHQKSSSILSQTFKKEEKYFLNSIGHRFESFLSSKT